MPREDAQGKGRRYLTEGRLRPLQRVRIPPGPFKSDGWGE
jgi:hypothetical protein